MKRSIVVNTIKLYLISLATLSIIRVFLFLKYKFSDLTTTETILSFIKGIQIDIITLNTFIGLFFLLLMIPSDKLQKPFFRKTVTFLWFLVLAIIILFCMGDLIYFGYVGRHMTREVLTITHDTGFMLKSAFSIYLPYTIVGFLLIIISGLIFYKISSEPIVIPKRTSERVFLIIFTILFLFIGARGKITHKPFGIADAFTNSKLSSGNLAINGFYSFYRTSFSPKRRRSHQFMSFKRAVSIVKQFLKSERTEFLNPKYPLLRQYTSFVKHKVKKPNFIIILLESFSAKYIDSFNRGVGVHFGVTPNFDHIASMGLKFTNFFANGIRSLDGITATLTGLVRPIGVDYLGNGLELSRLSYLPKLLKRKGYYSIMLQASWRRSLRVDSISRIAGFNEYYGAEDMKEKGPEINHPLLGTWDRNMYDFILKKLDHIHQPFFIFAFTAATHIPFISPGKRWEKYPHSEGSVTGFLNTLYYADWAIGNFIKKAKEKKWFSNTIFFFVADHTFLLNDAPLHRLGIFPHKRSLEFMRIPLIIYAPSIFYPKEITTIHSQVDIFNTILDLAGVKSPYADIGNSVFDKNANFALNLNGYYYTLVTPKGYIKSDLKSILARKGNVKESFIKAFDETLFKLIYTNTLIPPN